MTSAIRLMYSPKKLVQESNFVVSPKKIPAQTLKAFLHDGQEVALFDARDEVQHDQSHLFMASCVPLSRLELLIPQLIQHNNTRIVWCDNGEGVAELAAEKMCQLGYTNVTVLDGGIASWIDAGFSIYNGVHVPSKAFAEVIEHEVGTPWITVEELQEMADANEDFALFDTRTYEEFYDNGIPGAISAPGAELVLRFTDMVPSPDTKVVVHCGGRTRSIIGAQALIDAGYPNDIVSLRNGTQGWMLAGFDVIRESEHKAPPVSSAGLVAAKQAAQRIVDKFNIKTLSSQQLTEMQSRKNITTYIIDVRTREEFEQGHLAGAKHVHGGQLVQETERHLAVWGANVVVVDDNGVRAAITVAWLLQMGWHAYRLLLEEDSYPLHKGSQKIEPLKLTNTAPTRWISVEELNSSLTKGDVTVIDLDWSDQYSLGHIPGALWCIRSRLQNATLPQRSKMVLTSRTGVLAELAYHDQYNTDTDTLHVLKGGTQAWNAAGLPLETELQLLCDPDDIRLKARQESGDREAAMRRYLDWELGLVAELSKDDDPRYRISEYRDK